ncbi:hypothetical protein Hbl1158_02810 [Halobaculum sp. CBA1158]|uniref:hypothetical protein n=1 Tax=Halobaculum sp. CBA1158 TaxID=2904243 RepID=UPI001F1EBBA2|nr:hypothetical protein [Halobaculum sp. CBA1158]UIP00318.1 hypothetical protein Hbl1158_02810 [Halobaculum sp. CBA1158]
MTVATDADDSAAGDRTGEAVTRPDRWDALEPGDVLRCTEARDPVREDTSELEPELPRFRAVVDERDGDYVAATVTLRNRHYRCPDPDDELAKSIATMRADARWEVYR